MTKEEEAREAQRDLERTWRYILYALFLGLLVVVARFFVPYASAGLSTRVWSATGASLVSVLWSGAWFAASFLLGFLFGIPKAPLDRGGSAESERNARAPANGIALRPYRLRINTNLEDISDWLTKVLVGATLTQLGEIPGMVQRAARFVASGMGSFASETLAGAIIVYFSALGFFAGYVITRMFFAGAFERLSKGITSDDKEVLAEAVGDSEAPPIGDPWAATEPDTSAMEAAARMQQVQLTSALTASDALAVARGAHITQDSQRAVEAAKLAARKAPTDPVAQRAYAYALREAGADSSRVLAQLESTHHALRAAPGVTPQQREKTYNALVQLALSLDPPRGFGKAIEWGEEFLASTTPVDASVWVSLACAYGQRYSYEKHKSSDPNKQELERARAEVARCIQSALDRDPDSKRRLGELARPSDGDQDRRLPKRELRPLAEVVADTPDLKMLVE